MFFSTLFRYVFYDLVKIFLLTSGALAGIMSFGGLLRPLMQQGLSVDQVVSMLSYSMPAMTAYSLPIAALFSTTVVYGRLSADNEITACRSAGISYLWMTFPALIFGLLIAVISLITLCFVVPGLMYKSERVIFSNVAQIIAGTIERSKQIQFNQEGSAVTVFAQSARVEPEDPRNPNTQTVTLIAPMIQTYEPTPRNKRDGKPLDVPRVPKEFYLAKSASVFITQNPGSDNVSAMITLTEGSKFPRVYSGAQQGGIGSTQFGPLLFDSLVKENTKFMTAWRLRDLLSEPSKSRRVTDVLQSFTRLDQQTTFMNQLRVAMTLQNKEARLGGAEEYVITAGNGPVIIDNGELRLFGDPKNPTDYSVQLRQERAGVSVLSGQAREIRVKAVPDETQQRMTVTVELYDATIRAGDGEESRRNAFTRTFSVPMSKELMQVSSRPAGYYLQTSTGNSEAQQKIFRELTKLTNMLWSEIHARFSFALSCIILVLIGCALGMMFRSGNFLTAFALSVVPALVSIALIITGQHTCENVPWKIGPGFQNPLQLGLALIWSGNAVVAVIATGLLGYLYRR